MGKMEMSQFWLTFWDALWGGGQVKHLIWWASEVEILGSSGRGGCLDTCQGGRTSTLEPLPLQTPCLSRSRSSWSNFHPPLCLCLPPAPWLQRGQGLIIVHNFLNQNLGSHSKKLPEYFGNFSQKGGGVLLNFQKPYLFLKEPLNNPKNSHTTN